MENKASTTTTIVNSLGLHARPAAQIVQLLQEFKATVVFEKDHRSACANSILELVMLMAGPGDKITIIAVGPEAFKALQAVVSLIQQGFGEELSHQTILSN